MSGDFTEKWTTAVAGQIEKLMAAALSAEREACAAIVERGAASGASTAQIAAKITQRKLSDNQFLRTCQ